MPQRHEDIKFHKENFLPLTIEEEAIGKAIVNAAYTVHKTLGYHINFNLPLINSSVFFLDTAITKRLLRYARNDVKCSRHCESDERG